MIIGLTGGLATGKTESAKFFSEFGAFVIDADEISHKIIKPHSLIWTKIKNCFGEKILNPDLTIDRKKLGELVFNDKNALEKLEEIMHPVIIKEIKKIITKHKKEIIVIDAPLLFETNLDSITDFTIVIKTTKKTQIERIIKRNSISKEEANKRIGLQIPLKLKVQKADFVINNNGSLNTLKKNIFHLFKVIKNKE